jgi:hypothetical protein
MKKKVKKFAMGGMGSNTSPIQTGVRLAPPPDRVDGAPVRTLGMQNQQGGMPRGMGGMGGMGGLGRMGGLGNAMGGMGGMGGTMGRGSSLSNSSGMGKLSNMSPQKIADLRSAAQQAGNIPPRPIQAGFGPISSVNSTTTRDMMGGAVGLGGLRNSSNLPPLGNAMYQSFLSQRANADAKGQVFKKGGAVKASKSVSSVSKRADGVATKGKTRGKMI